MPWVTINMLAGRSAEKKQALHEKVCAAVSEALEIPIDKIRIQLIEMEEGQHSIGGVLSEKKK